MENSNWFGLLSKTKEKMLAKFHLVPRGWVNAFVGELLFK